MGNEPSYVDGGESPARREIYYHSGLDIGGCEGMVDVLSACDGLVVSAGGKALPEYAEAPFYKPHGDYDYVYIHSARRLTQRFGPQNRRAFERFLQFRLLEGAPGNGSRRSETGHKNQRGTPCRQNSARPHCLASSTRTQSSCSPWDGATNSWTPLLEY